MSASPSAAARASTGRHLLRSAGIAVLIAAAALFVYAPARHGGWLWDDHIEITDNPMLRDPAGWLKCWWAPAGADYFPLKDCLLWVQWQVWRGQVEGYHMTNVALHVLSSLLLWRLLSKLAVPCAWLGGLLFAIHPVAVESVAWVSEFKNTLSLAFLLGSALAYMAYTQRAEDRRPGRTISYALCLALFVLSLLSKSAGALFPALLLAYPVWKRGRPTWREIVWTVPFFVVAATLGAVTVWFQYHRAGGTGSPDPGNGAALPAFAPILAAAFYIAKAAVPTGLAPIYPRSVAAILSPTALSSGMLVVAVIGLAWSRRQTWGRNILFAVAAYFLMLLPVLGFVPMAYGKISPVADHLQYAALPVVAALIAGSFGLWLRGARGRRRFLPAACAAAFSIMLALEGRACAAHYRDAEALWTYAVRRNPEASIAQNNLGACLAARQLWAPARARFEAALRLQPDYAEARHNLGRTIVHEGIAAAMAGNWTGAVSELSQAVAVNPADADAHFRYALALWHVGRTDEAIAQRAEALRLDPSLPP